MRQFDVVASPEPRANAVMLVVLQHDAVEDRSTLIVAPCIAVAIGPKGRRLTPEVQIDGTAYLVVVPEMSAIPRRLLSAKPIANLAAYRDAFTSAIDLLFTGV